MILNLEKGRTIIAKRIITDTMISHWKYARENDTFGGSFITGSAFKVVEVGKLPGSMWVRVAVPGSDPAKYLKISGEEFAGNFKSYGM